MSDTSKARTYEEAVQAVNNWIVIRAAKDENSDAEIDIDGDIGYDWWTGDDSNTAKAIKARLKEIANTKAKRILVSINSLGGYVHEGLGIHDALAANAAEIITDVRGVAASMATVIAQAGNTRKMSDNALYLVHQVRGGNWGNITQTEAYLEELKAWNDRLVKIYVKRTGTAEEDIRELMDRDNGEGVWIDADEALEMGLIDEVYEPMEMAASKNPRNLPKEAFIKNRLPQIPEDKRTLLNSEDMSEDKKTVSQMLAEMKTNIVNEIRTMLNLGEDDPLPKEVSEKLNEFDTRIKEAETGAEEATTRAETAEAEVTRLTGELETATENLTAKEGEVETLTARVTKVEGELTKAQGESTKIKGPQGGEDPNKPKNKDQAEWDAEAEKIKAVFMNTHDDGGPSGDEE